MNTLEPESERCTSRLNFKKILDQSTNVFTKLIRNNKRNTDTKSYDETISNKNIKLNDKMLREIMTSRTDTFSINIYDNIDSILKHLENVKHSKIPVYEKNIDNIIGILNVDDLIFESKKVGFKELDIRQILNRAHIIPETKKVSELFNSIDSKSDELFILVDEYGGFSGIVSINDLIYELNGLIYDKSNLKHNKIKKIDDNNFIVKGFLTVSDFNKIFGDNIEQGDYDTLNGYIINKLGQIPHENEDIQLNLGKLIIKLIKINNRRIEDIQISII